MQFTSATYRLKVGVPATVEHAGSHHVSNPSETTTDQVSARHIAETVEVDTRFSGLMRNSLRLWMLSS